MKAEQAETANGSRQGEPWGGCAEAAGAANSLDGARTMSIRIIDLFAFQVFARNSDCCNFRFLQQYLPSADAQVFGCHHSIVAARHAIMVIVVMPISIQCHEPTGLDQSGKSADTQGPRRLTATRVELPNAVYSYRAQPERPHATLGAWALQR